MNATIKVLTQDLDFITVETDNVKVRETYFKDVDFTTWSLYYEDPNKDLMPVLGTYESADTVFDILLDLYTVDTCLFMMPGLPEEIEENTIEGDSYGE